MLQGHASSDDARNPKSWGASPKKIRRNSKLRRNCITNALHEIAYVSGGDIFHAADLDFVEKYLPSPSRQGKEGDGSAT